MDTNDNLVYIYRHTYCGELQDSFGFVRAKDLTYENMISGPLRDLKEGERFYYRSGGVIVIKKVYDLEKIQELFSWYTRQEKSLYAKFYDKEFGNILKDMFNIKIKNTNSEVENYEELAIMMEMMIDEL